jgi:hypothetical protein
MDHSRTRGGNVRDRQNLPAVDVGSLSLMVIFTATESISEITVVTVVPNSIHRMDSATRGCDDAPGCCD